LLRTAHELHALHGRAVIQSTQASRLPLWQPFIGNTLQSINLPRHENGLYANDALQFNFGDRQIIVQLSNQEGLELFVYDEP